VNVTGDVAKQAIEGLKGTPALLVIILLNCVMLAMFAFVLAKVSDAIERRDAVIKSCLEQRRP
jgi:hypothetical protein